jgi:hypothetical protein
MAGPVCVIQAAEGRGRERNAPASRRPASGSRPGAGLSTSAPCTPRPGPGKSAPASGGCSAACANDQMIGALSDAIVAVAQRMAAPPSGRAAS